MTQQSSQLSTVTDPLPLHELISHLLAPETNAARSLNWRSGLGTMQFLNQRLAHQPLPNFMNALLRGVGQVIFVNNPISGLLILIAMFIHSGWLGSMALVGTVAATLRAIALRLNREEIQNGIFGLNGLLAAAKMVTIGATGNGNWNLSWAIAIVVFSAFTTGLMETVGVWFAKKFKAAPLGIPFHAAVLSFVLLILFLPQPFFNLGTSAVAASTSALDGWRLAQSLIMSMGQVFFSDQLIAGCLIFIAITICTPIGTGVGLLGGTMYVLAGLRFKATLNDLYTGLWGYNAVLTAIAIGGVFYAPTQLSIAIGVGCAFLASIVSWWLAALLTPLQLPVIALPFSIVAIGCFLLLRRTLPSLVPVALHTVASPEEHCSVTLPHGILLLTFVGNWRLQCKVNDGVCCLTKPLPLSKAICATSSTRSITIATINFQSKELAIHLQQAGKSLSNDELIYLFKSMDSDGSRAIDFEEFGELMLRHHRLMSRYTEFLTYFLPIDTNEDDMISIDEMNTAMASVGQAPLSKAEIQFLHYQIGKQPLTWHRFIEMLLVT